MNKLGDYEILQHVADDPPWRLYRAERKKGTHPYRASGADTEASGGLILRMLNFIPGDAAELAWLEAGSVATTYRHPNIEEVLEWDSKNRFCIEPLRFGWRLHLVLGDQHVLAPPIVCHIARSLCEGLRSLHEIKGPDDSSLGVAHGDVRPHTVLLTSDGKVLLRNPALRMSRSGPSLDAFGPPTVYSRFSPEHAAGLRPLPTSDVFQLGLLIDEMLTGAPAFQRGPAFQTLTAITNEPISPTSTRSPETIHPAFDDVVMRAVAKKPENRYGSIAELDEALRQIERDEAWNPRGDDALRRCLEDTRAHLRPRIGGFL